MISYISRGVERFAREETLKVTANSTCISLFLAERIAKFTFSKLYISFLDFV